MRIHCTPRSLIATLAASAALLFVANVAAAQAPKPIKEEKPGLLSRATITAEQARTTALARIKGGVIKDEEIEQEDGKLVFSFDIKVADKSGIDEVLVDAKTGAIVSVEHETPKDEAREAAKDAKKKPATKKPSAPTN
jgi:hypothetical protein